MQHITRSTPPLKHTPTRKKNNNRPSAQTKKASYCPAPSTLPPSPPTTPHTHTHTQTPSLTLSQTSNQIQTRFAACSSLTVLQTSQQGIHYNTVSQISSAFPLPPHTNSTQLRPVRCNNYSKIISMQAQ